MQEDNLDYHDRIAGGITQREYGKENLKQQHASTTDAVYAVADDFTRCHNAITLREKEIAVERYQQEEKRRTPIMQILGYLDGYLEESDGCPLGYP